MKKRSHRKENDFLHLSYRRFRRSTDWVRKWIFSADVHFPHYQFERLNPEE
jgi:hypothetical protein